MNSISAVAQKLEHKAATYVKENRVPGAAVAVVRDDSLAWWAPVGFADVAARKPAEPTTLFRIASITKTFTGTAIMQLRDEGKLRLDDPAVQHIPELRQAMSPFGDIEAVTIRRMLSHEAGLMSEPPGTDWRAARYEGSVRRNLERASEIGTKIPPNSQQKYSNLAFQLLGEIVARCSGASYPEYVGANILEPLGMRHTFFEPLAPEMAARSATGYAGRFVSDELNLSSTAPRTGAEGGLWSCIDDLARWVSFQFREDGGERNGAQILRGSTLKEMHTPRYLADEGWNAAYGIAWYAWRRGSVVWIQHSGALHGFRSNVCFDPKMRVGAIVLINGVAIAPVLSMDLAEIAREAVLAEPPRIEPPPPMPQAYRTLVGVYHDRDLGALMTLEWRDGKLMVVLPALPDWRPTLAPTENPDMFLIEPGVRESGENAVFRRTPDGRVAAVFIAAGTWLRLESVT
ncbi:MAG TPA: serine hydrolase domain-containing protein [Candidatus Dormibacteraeota bacterium]|nr:serine hydrolase domain-containing protein [Candidatus Dormibacteraeota bacterium]